MFDAIGIVRRTEMALRPTGQKSRRRRRRRRSRNAEQ
jgi:hypothetical protein